MYPQSESHTDYSASFHNFDKGIQKLTKCLLFWPHFAFFLFFFFLIQLDSFASNKQMLTALRVRFIKDILTLSSLKTSTGK